MQNLVLRKILEAFKNSFSIAIKLEAAIALLKVKFNRICKNYTLRIMQISKNYLIRLRVSSSFPPYNNEAELDWEKYLDWNEKNQSIETKIAEISSKSESKQRYRRKRRKVKRKLKKNISQLFKITFFNIWLTIFFKNRKN